MEQLSGLDNLFLTMEDHRQHMHIASLGLYDPSSAEGGKVRFKQVLDFFANKVNEVSFFRWRLAAPPFNMDRPFWVDDGDVDVEYHVRHIALPKPGDWRQLMIQVARLHSCPLDQSNPLWEAYVIGGLDNIEGIAKGSFALYLKMHHAAVDGQAAARLIQILHTVGPEYERHPEPDTLLVDPQPNSAELAMRSALHRASQVVQGAKMSLELGATTARLGTKYLPGALQDIQASLFSKKPKGALGGPSNKTRFDKPISPHRSVDATGVSLKKCKTIRERIPGATINDIFMATSGGAVRMYLKAHKELPKDSVQTMMPMAAAPDAAGNSVTMAIIPLHTEIADPIERLGMIKQSTQSAKALQDDVGRELLPQLMDVMPAVASKKILEYGVQGKASMTVSNVRGPDVPLYLAGARCQMFVPVSFPADHMGLNITGFSYLDTLWICTTACREMLPDPAFFSECLRESFDEILQAAISAGDAGG